MAWRTFQSRVRRGSLTIAAATAFTISCGEGTGPVPLEPLVGALQVSAASPSGWGFFEDDDTPGPIGTFVTGPNPSPAGFGSARFFVSDPGHRPALGTLEYSGVPLEDIRGLEYWTYTEAGAPNAVTLQFDVDWDGPGGNSGYQGRLVYEPAYNGTPTSGTWQAWEPLDGRWWATAFGGNLGGQRCPQSGPGCTWTEIRDAFPDAIIRGGGQGVLLFKAGGGWASFTGYVDKFTIATKTGTEVYDFEPSLEPCSFEPAENARRVRLTADCTTDHTLYIPNGWTLDGAHHTITAEDPQGGPFRGAVLRNGGALAHVRNLRIVGHVSGCLGGADRLRGIYFESASGTILFNTVENIRRGTGNGCQEGNGIEARQSGLFNRPQHVTISNNRVLSYQKTGVVVTRTVDTCDPDTFLCDIFSVTDDPITGVISGNDISSAGLDDLIAANSIQVSYGAHASIHGNNVQGNDWDGDSYYSATAMLLYQAGNVEVSSNQIGAGAPTPLDEKTDIGIYAFASGVVNVMNNYIGRHTETEGGPCAGRDDGNWLNQDPPAVVPDDKCDPDGVGVYFFGNSGISKVVSNRFSSNWQFLQVGADRDHHNRVGDPIH